MELFRLVVEDMSGLQRNPLCYRLVPQQVGSADSICANLEEGYGRTSRSEFARFIDFSRGSARETRGRYQRMAFWLPPEVVADRVALCDEIIRILTRTLATLRTSNSPTEPPMVREDGCDYGTAPDTPTRHSTLVTRHIVRPVKKQSVGIRKQPERKARHP